MASPMKLTIILDTATATIVENAISEGDYASESDIIHAALHDWNAKKNAQIQEFKNLKIDINKGLDDMSQGRVEPFDSNRIVERGRMLFSNANST